MASPVGHALVGVGLAAIAERITGVPPSPALWLGSAIASGLPDLDLIGLAFGLGLHRVHRRATHSLVILGILALATVWAPCLFAGVASPGLALVWSVALLSHPVVDVLTTGPKTGCDGYGIPLFWPLASRRWYVRRPLVRSVSLTSSFAFGQVWRGLLPELCLFGSLSVALILLGHLL